MRPELIRAAELLKRSDSDSVNEALHLLQSTVFSFSMKVCGHREDAEDTMQHVLLKSVSHLKKIDSPEALAVWLYKVTRNRCWMSRRRSKFAPDRTLSLDELMPSEGELESLTDSQRDIETATALRQEADRVRDTVLKIPPKYRIVLVLHDMEELDSAEIAQILNISEGSVRVRLHRARLFVRRELAKPVSAKNSARRSSARKKTRPLECRKLFAGLSEFIDGNADQLSCEHIQKHLADCPPCVAFVEDLSRAVERCKNVEVQCDPKVANTVLRLLLDEYRRYATPR